MGQMQSGTGHAGEARWRIQSRVRRVAGSQQDFW